jgi:hypothetical protein
LDRGQEFLIHQIAAQRGKARMDGTQEHADAVLWVEHTRFKRLGDLAEQQAPHPPRRHVLDLAVAGEHPQPPVAATASRTVPDQAHA